MAFEQFEQRVNFALSNAAVYGVRHKIDVIKGKPEGFRCRRKVDAVVITLDYENLKTSTENFCLFANLMPDIRKAFENSMELTENIVLIIPKFVDVSELALLFAEARTYKNQLFIFLN